MGSINDLFLDEHKLEHGYREDVVGLDGKPTGDWIEILYMHSDAAQAAMINTARAEHEAGGVMDENTPPSLLARKYRHCLVAGWSFDEPCTPENIKTLFSRNPELAQRLQEKALNKRLFFIDSKQNSSPGQKTKSA